MSTNLLLLCIVFYAFVCAYSTQCPCENGGSCLANSSVCLCKPNFLGQICNITATQLSQDPKNISVNENFSYVYLEPPGLSFYEIQLRLCLQKPSIGYQNQVYFSLQGTNSEFTPNSEDDKKLYELPFSDGSCLNQTFRYLWYKRKTNEEIQKIIMGIRIKKETRLFSEEKGPDQKETEIISISCEIQQIFNLQLLIRIIFIFFAFVGFIMVSSLFYVVIQKYRRYREEKKQKMKNIILIKKIMPSKKYSVLNQQTDGEHLCSICLTNFEKEDVVRKTPCEHVFHQQCLDGWCKKHMSCPICRLDLQEINFQGGNINESRIVREPML